MKLAKATNLLVGILSVIFAIKIESVLEILIYSYNFWAPIILAPFVSAVLGLKVNSKNFFAGAAGGVAVYALSALYLSKIIALDNIVFGVIGNFVFFFGYYFYARLRIGGRPV